MNQTPTFERIALNALRIVAGFLFFQHGAAKLWGWFGGSVVEFPELVFWAGIIEFFTGILIMLGILTRPLAVLASGTMAAAYFIAHVPQGFWPYANGGTTAALYCFVFLYIALRGGGRFSVDGLLARRRRKAEVRGEVDRAAEPRTPDERATA